MTVTLDDWRRLYEICDHRDRLHNDELDLFVERPDAVSRRIAEDLRDRFETRGKWLICGSVGAGKSSELIRIYQLLRDEFVVVGVDLERSTGKIEHVTPPEILFCIGAAAVRTAKERLGHDVDPTLVAELCRAFEGLLDEGRTIDLLEFVGGVALFGVELLAPGTRAITNAALGAVKTATGPVRASVGRTKVGGLTRPVKDGDPSLDRLVAAVDAVLADIRAGVRKPLVLVDGLDKITEVTAIREIFATSRALSGPQVPLIYSGPITLMIHTEWNAAENHFSRERLANLVVAPPPAVVGKVSPATVDAGRAGMRDVAHRRCAHVGLELDDVFSRDGLEMLISKSGGLLRQFIMLLRNAAREAGRQRQPRIELDTATLVCDELRKNFEITLTKERREELEYIAEYGEATGGSLSNELLLWNYAFPYSNGQAWFAPNPLINLSRRKP
ncbi:MAG TPA: hypothetical protein VK034_00350 [Enhygromyxa sp.]|nr:hypothetical protein [Enhygromyxa sp.]